MPDVVPVTVAGAARRSVHRHINNVVPDVTCGPSHCVPPPTRSHTHTAGVPDSWFGGGSWREYPGLWLGEANA